MMTGKSIAFSYEKNYRREVSGFGVGNSVDWKHQAIA
jgi:hypothetical protein